MNFKQALDAAIKTMITDPKNEDGFCIAVYDDACDSNNAMVMFMEYESYGSVHAAMAEIQKLISDNIGHSVAICHNHPSDENVLIHGAPYDARPYSPEECCKEDTIRCCLDFLQTRKGYRPEYQALALLAETIADRDCVTVSMLLESLDWNVDPLPQLVMNYVV